MECAHAGIRIGGSSESILITRPMGGYSVFYYPYPPGSPRSALRAPRGNPVLIAYSLLRESRLNPPTVANSPGLAYRSEATDMATRGKSLR